MSLFANVLRLLIRRGVLVEVPAQGLDAHVAAVGHQVGDGGVGGLHGQLHACHHLRHAGGNRIGRLPLVVVAVEEDLNLVLQLVVRLLALAQALAQGLPLHVLKNAVDGRRAHLYPRVAFPQEADRVLFDHVVIPFRGQDARKAGRLSAAQAEGRGHAGRSGHAAAGG